MFLAIIIGLSLCLTYLILKNNKESNKNKLNINRGWKVTPYLSLRISSFESRIDLEKMRLKELIKNTVRLIDEKVTFIDCNSEGFYIKSKNELIYIKFLVGDKKVEKNKGSVSFKNNEIIKLELYNTIRSTIGKYIWFWEEEFISPLESAFNIKFSSGHIIMKISKEDKIIFNKDEENNTLKNES
ncbi:hypothetical protein ACV3P7_05980 [Clostridium perfringens]|uniref:hypothetical protein n=1 Tax=Clostridium perfringens TaxID=1502 RepID=UPI0024BC259B|nr:hypothetical protein [Clostridium perfringens]EGT3598706.1 hypothetical protein [Clostridium perfringens]MDK0536840.1 hypothetical protein [Clostridium perfringens]MDM0453353.1 hypothetical protein [Clostridium perfringens]MDM0462068.1 hypothetical protein [Clostridium perfringens]MDM0468026.1 hypothetical protein [Clostridium perfringens]